MNYECPGCKVDLDFSFFDLILVEFWKSDNVINDFLYFILKNWLFIGQESVVKFIFLFFRIILLNSLTSDHEGAATASVSINRFEILHSSKHSIEFIRSKRISTRLKSFQVSMGQIMMMMIGNIYFNSH